MEWQEDEPLRWTMSEVIGKGKRAELKSYAFDLTPLMKGYARDFLLALKECWVDWRHHVKLSTIRAEIYPVQRVLQACQDGFVQLSIERGEAPPVFDRINSDLLMGLWAVQRGVPNLPLTRFRSFYSRNRNNRALFQADLHSSDFPVTGEQTEDPSDTDWQTEDSSRPGCLGRLRKNILASAFNRAMLVHILNITEAAYEAGELSLGVFAYSRLLLTRAARPESFRELRLKDLRIDKIDGAMTYYLTITIPKTKTAERPFATVRLPPDVGKILDRQRDAVAQRLKGLIDRKNATLQKTAALSKSTSTSKLEEYTIGDLPMFPSGDALPRMLRKTKDRLGMAGTTPSLTKYYLPPLKQVTGAKIDHRALRHTMGTQLAIAGCAASTIAAVLLHATHRAASVYVDLVFSGAIDELSDSLEPAFAAHYPVINEFRSINDKIDSAKRIISSSVDRSRRETTAECGRRQICEDAPIACYECSHFKPCYDADHTINLERVDEEIASARAGGLPRQVDFKKYMHIANRIRVVIYLCEAKREAITAAREEAQ